MKDQEESSLRIIIYVIVVIILGVAAALGVRHFLLNDDSSEDNTDTTATNTETEEETGPVEVDVVAALDSQASNKPMLEDYVDSELITVGDSEATSSSLNALSYKRFTTFGRFSLVASSDFPNATIAYDSTANTISITLDETTTIIPELKTTTTVNDLVKQITFDAKTNKFTLSLAKSSKYSVQVVGNSLILDIKTNDQLEIDLAANEAEVEEPEVIAPETDTKEETDMPTGTNIKNEFSEDKQYISNPEVTGNTVAQDVYYYEDTPDYFEFAWGTKNKVGDKYIPNASAELVTTGGKNYIEVKIQNLSKEVFQSFNITGTALTQTNVDLSGANFVRIDLKSFENGTATYRIELKRKAEFRLLSEPTVDKTTQVVSIQIKD